MLLWVRAFNIPVGFLYLLLEQLFLLIRMRSVADLFKKQIQRLLFCGIREDLLWLANHHGIRSSPKLLLLLLLRHKRVFEGHLRDYFRLYSFLADLGQPRIALQVADLVICFLQGLLEETILLVPFLERPFKNRTLLFGWLLSLHITHSPIPVKANIFGLPDLVEWNVALFVFNMLIVVSVL